MQIETYLETLELEELVALRKELAQGALNIKRIVHKRITEERRRHGAKCSTCQAPIEPVSTSSFTLVFGPDDFKKKASFCAMDCLEYFLEQLRTSYGRG